MCLYNIYTNIRVARVPNDDTRTIAFVRNSDQRTTDNFTHTSLSIRPDLVISKDVLEVLQDNSLSSE